jgi:hypothetical protein
MATSMPIAALIQDSIALEPGELCTAISLRGPVEVK